MPKTHYTTVNGMLIGERTDGGNRIDYVPDALGSIVAAVDQNLNTTYTAAYKPYGDVLASTGTAPRFTWVGGLGYLASAGVAYAEYSVRARIYSSKSGRWIGVDPLWPLENAYDNSDSNPATFSDPTGLSPCSSRSTLPTPNNIAAGLALALCRACNKEKNSGLGSVTLGLLCACQGIAHINLVVSGTISGTCAVPSPCNFKGTFNATYQASFKTPICPSSQTCTTASSCEFNSSSIFGQVSPTFTYGTVKTRPTCSATVTNLVISGSMDIFSNTSICK